MRRRFRAHIALFLLLISTAYVLPTRVLHACMESHPAAEIHLGDLPAATEGVESTHVKCYLCDFHAPPFVSALSEPGIQIQIAPHRFSSPGVPTPDLPLCLDLATRAPPIA